MKVKRLFAYENQAIGVMLLCSCNNAPDTTASANLTLSAELLVPSSGPLETIL